MAIKRGLFIDLDGTLADSLDLLQEIYYRFLHEFGHAGNQQEFARLNGPKVAEFVPILQKNYALPGSVEDLLHLYNRLIDEAYADVAPRPGSLRLLQSAVAADWSVTVVTSNTGPRARAWLKAQGLDSYVTGIVSGERDCRGKPWPDLYLEAIRLSKCSLPDSFAVEDSPNGARAAIDAGLQTFVCPNEPPIDAVWPVEARFIPSLENLIPILQK